MENGNYPVKASVGYSLESEELPMTMQVGMVGADGIVLASDTKWVTVGLDSIHGPFRHPEYKSKIKIDGEIAICCAGDDMDSSTLVADEIISRWREGDGDELQRIRAIVMRLFKKRPIECLVAIAVPTKILIRILVAKIPTGVGSKTEWSFNIASVWGVQTAGDIANDAVFWCRYYDKSLSVQELKGLAAHVVVEANNFNNAMVDGLEIVYSDASGFHRGSDAENDEWRAKSEAWGKSMGRLIMGTA